MNGVRVALSLFAAFIGWLTGLAYYVACGYLGSALGWRSDLDFIAFYTALFILIGWFVAFLPVLRVIEPESKLYSLTRFPVVGGILGLAAFMVLVGWWTPIWMHWFYAVYPVVVGC